MSTLMEIMSDKQRVNIQMSTLMEIMLDKPRVSVDVNTNSGDSARQATHEYRCQH